MHGIWLWILISIVLGTIAALVFVYAGSKRKDAHNEGIGDKDEVDDDGDDLDDEDVSHRTRNILLLITVFSVLAFLIVWLVMAFNSARLSF